MSKKFHVTAPDGSVIEVTGPDDATVEQAIEYAKSFKSGFNKSMLEPKGAQPEDVAHRGFWDSATQTARGVKDMLTDAYNRGDLGAHVVDQVTGALKDKLSSTWNEYQKSGRDPRVLAKAAYDISGLHNTLSTIDKQQQAGNWPGAFGTAIDQVLQIALPEYAPRIPGAVARTAKAGSEAAGRVIQATAEAIPTAEEAANIGKALQAGAKAATPSLVKAGGSAAAGLAASELGVPKTVAAIAGASSAAPFIKRAAQEGISAFKNILEGPARQEAAMRALAERFTAEKAIKEATEAYYTPEPPTVAQQVLEAQGKQQELAAQGLEKLKGQAQSVEGQTLGEVAKTPEIQEPVEPVKKTVNESDAETEAKAKRKARAEEVREGNKQNFVKRSVDYITKNFPEEKNWTTDKLYHAIRHLHHEQNPSMNSLLSILEKVTVK